ncbi:MAG: D-alanine--D-alanine ligase [Oscillospiraceae bacterium]|nr:D-alanine--D-alanine ligase [Ruminococcus sp.]MBQ7003647.1 D-alanine--D-alanine ligase [Oscillospiraceae bacterium]MBQ7013959.1 D-alanine--D-alanine ligase [Oscillospiraceae bacterium]
MSKIRVAVLFGGASSEHDISLKSATHIIDCIPRDKYEVVCVGITKKGRWLYYPGDTTAIASGAWEHDSDCTSAILSPDPIHKGLITIENGEASIKKIDVVFPVLHGKNGEDGTIQGLLDLARIPYVGCGLLASAACMDKAATHTMLDYNGIRTAKWRMIVHREINRMEQRCREIGEELGYPLFVKPANAGSSIGVNKADDLEELIEAVKIAFSHDNKVIIEECIVGRELEVAVFGYDSPFASFVGEIESCKTFYDYDAKYILSGSNLIIPAQIPDEKGREIQQTAVKAYQALGCKGLSRVDFFLQEDGTVILNEINTMPGFTSISMYPKLMEDLGMSPTYLVEKLIEQAIDNADRTYL